MEFNYFSRNGKLLPIKEAVVPLSNIEYQYGFGVYETIHIANGTTYFLADHIDRLMESARIIGLQHSFTPEFISDSIVTLLEKNAAASCNVKIVLLGGTEPSLDILCLNPLFPGKKLYRDGVHCITHQYERAFPHAKTLNMLQSYLAYHKAKFADAYDALLLDGEGNMLEGTRTNFSCIKGKTIYSPSEEKILLGVTRKHVLDVAAKNNFAIKMQDIQYADISAYDGVFLTSTSSKIMPIRSIDTTILAPIPSALRELMWLFDEFLAQQKGALE